MEKIMTYLHAFFLSVYRKIGFKAPCIPLETISFDSNFNNTGSEVVILTLQLYRRPDFYFVIA